MRDRIRQFVSALADMEVLYDSLPNEFRRFIVNSNGASRLDHDKNILNDLTIFFSLASKCGNQLAERIGDDYSEIVLHNEKSSYDMVFIGCQIALEYLESSGIGRDCQIEVQTGTVSLVEFLKDALGRDEEKN